MAITKYIRGRTKEYAAKELLQKEGFDVIRASSSKGIFDLVAIKPYLVRLIQVKSVKTKYSSFAKEIKFLKSYQVPNSVSIELWIWWTPKKDRGKRGWEILVLNGG